MLKNLTSWAPRPKPSHLVLEEKYVRLEPLNAQKHEQGLFEACTPPDAEKMFFYMLTAPPQDRQEFNKWMVNAEKSENPLFFVIIDKASGKIGGRQMFKNIDEKHGYIEIGGVLWNDPIRKRPAATEAVYLFAKHIFEDLGYRRFEWRCNSRNAASRQAALRFGFQYEATFLYHMGTKGQNRDTTIFAMLDCQWPAIKQAFEEWLSPENFDENGVQKLKLNEIRSKYEDKESLDVSKHADGMCDIVLATEAKERFRYLLVDPPKTREEEMAWLERNDQTEPFYIVIDKSTEKVVGSLGFHDPDVNNGALELGVYFSGALSRRPGGTEAIYLMMKFAFDELKYRRFVWACDNRNKASKNAALRYGFTYEAGFRQELFIKKENKDACFYSVIDKDWPLLKRAFEIWLDPSNFDKDGVQKERLEEIRKCIAQDLGVSLPSIDPPPPEISVEESEHNALSIDMRNWTPRQPPSKVLLKGQYVYLEPLDIRKHGDGLYEVCTMPDGDKRFDWLPEHPAKSREEFQAWLEKAQASTDPLYFVVIDKASGKVAGRQTFLRIVLDHGVIEVGHILWSSIIARKPAATEALYLFAKYMFDDLGYRRFEWKCNNLNEASKKAAIRFGFRYEGIFRQHMVVKGQNRDTAWFAMLNSDWPLCKQAFEKWLDPENFDENGQQKRKLNDIRDEIKVNLFKN